jgi:hypothetical protein
MLRLCFWLKGQENCWSPALVGNTLQKLDTRQVCNVRKENAHRTYTHRIHGAIYGNTDPINIPQSC